MGSYLNFKIVLRYLIKQTDGMKDRYNRGAVRPGSEHVFNGDRKTPKTRKYRMYVCTLIYNAY